MAYIFAIALGLIANVIMSYLQFNSTATLIVTFLIVFVSLLFPTYRILLWETNVEKIEKFLLKKQKEPTYLFIYSLANENDENAVAALNKLLTRYKQPHKQALFKTMYNLYKKDVVKAKEDIESIKPELYKNYYQAGLLIEAGDYQGAKQLVQQISNPWMKHAVLAEIAKKEGNQDEAIQFAKLAFQQAKGLNKYSLYKAYERDYPEIVK